MMAATLAEAQTLSVERAEPFVTDVDTERHALTTVDEPWTVVARALSRDELRRALGRLAGAG